MPFDNNNVDLVSDLGDDGIVPANGGDVNALAPSAAPAGALSANAQPGKPAVAAPVEGAEPSLRDRLSAAFKGPEGAVTDQPGADTNNGPARNPDGTFAAKPAEAAAAAATDPNAALVVVQPPRDMSHEDVQKFNALPPEMQQYVAQRTQALETRAAEIQGLQDVRAIIEQRRGAWAMNGMTEGQALTQLLALSDFATQRPQDFLQYFAQQNRIDLSALVNGGGQPVGDPNFAQLQQQFGQLSQTVNGLTQQQHQEAHNQVVNEVVQFAEAKDANGQPLRPYFQELGEGIKPYLSLVMEQHPNFTREQMLTEAYDRACWATPSIRARIQKATEAQQLSAQAAAGKRASGAAVSVTGAPAGGVGQSQTINTDGSVRDILQAQFAAATGQV